MSTIAEAIYHEAAQMPDEGHEELLVMAIGMLDARGLATADDYNLLGQLEGADMSVQLSFIAGQQSSVSPFEAIKHTDDRGEYWLARELQGPLGYHGEFRFFDDAIARAKIACKNSGQIARDHFVDTHGMVSIGSGAQRAVKDYRLSRYACYLVAMNGDPRKQAISEAQTYFAVQTRRQEVADQQIAAGDYTPSPELAALRVAMVALEAHDRRLAALEAWRHECQAVETTPILPVPTVQAPEKTVRAALNELVRSAARRRDVPYHTLWNQLYHELKYRIGFDVEARAANSGAERLDIIEAHGHIDELYAIACEIL